MFSSFVNCYTYEEQCTRQGHAVLQRSHQFQRDIFARMGLWDYTCPMRNLFFALTLFLFTGISAQALETATFAGGCYWGMEEFFRKIPGVMETRVGFTGGTVPNPKYDDTHDGHTGHAESVEIKFDPAQVTYTQLLDQFFKIHDPTTKNRQGNDTGNQYRSAIFYHSEKQKKEARDFIVKVEKSKAWKAPLTTEVSEAKTFWPAEQAHQKYLMKNPGGYNNHYLRKISFAEKGG